MLFNPNLNNPTKYATESWLPLQNMQHFGGNFLDQTYEIVDLSVKLEPETPLKALNKSHNPLENVGQHRKQNWLVGSQ